MRCSSSARPERARGAARVVCAALALAVCGGCRVDIDIGIEQRTGGDGIVRAVVGLDREAMAEVGKLEEALRVDDLTKGGWIVETRAGEDGGGTVEARREFDSPAEDTAYVSQLSGPTGPFRDFRIRQQRTFAKTTTDFVGVVDLTPGIEGFGDDDLRSRLGGSSIGIDPAELERRLGRQLAQIFRIRVATRLPGDVTSNAPSQVDNGAAWRPLLGERVELRAHAEKWNVGNLVAASVFALSGVLLAAVATGRLLERRRRAQPPVDDGPSGAPDEGPLQPHLPTGATPAPPQEPGGPETSPAPATPPAAGGTVTPDP